MLLTCPNCTVSYELPIDLPDDGKKVRCAKCSHVWVAYPTEEEQVAFPSETSEDNAELDMDSEMEALAADPMAAEIDEAIDEDFLNEIEEIVAQEPDMPESPMDDIGVIEQEDEPAPMMEADVSIEEQEQQAIDALLDEAASALDAGDETNDQAGIDSLFDEPVAANEENDQAGIDSLFDDPTPEPEPVPEPVLEEIPEPVVAEAAPPPAPELPPQPEPQDLSPPAQEIATMPVERRRRPGSPPPPQKEKNNKGLLVAAGWGGLVFLIFGGMTFAYLNGDSVVQAVPQTAGLYEKAGAPVNIRGLEFRGVSYSWEAESGKPVLHVKGSVVNVTDKTLNVPKIVFALRDEKGTELFHWAKNVYQEPLSAGQSAAFNARIPSPPSSVRSLQVRFSKTNPG